MYFLEKIFEVVNHLKQEKYPPWGGPTRELFWGWEVEEMSR